MVKPPQKLSDQLNDILSRMAEADKIPAYRLDAKSKVMQNAAQDAITLTGAIIVEVEKLMHQVLMLQSDVEVGRQALIKSGVIDEENQS
ncbi:hypothetical protein [Shewanella sp. SR43-8]|uniref:hypothetical protein n=1 Tax=Shewanella sp. SR43-8 TaxID=2760938 RepID=UPI0015FFFBB3|nr:hypothetical protein [Shewanella sp. SR43-8]MBB1322128.1 hypothetical protein [Shewanella sp. SR43-8]